jgi:hypothetical protein
VRAKSIKGKDPNEIQTALEESKADGFRPTLAILFISIKQDRMAIYEIFQENGIEVFGASSSGEFTDGNQSEGEIAGMLLDIKGDHFKILFEDIGERSLETAARLIAEKATRQFDKPALILCSTFLKPDGTALEGEVIIRSIEKIIGPQVTMFGGMAGDDITFTGPYVFAGKEVTTHGIVALVLDEDKIDFVGMAISGWKPIGLYKKVTKSEGNIVYSIDDQPALQIYLRFLGQDISASTDDQVKFFESVGVHYPLQIEREGRAPIMCSPMGYDQENGGLVCDCNVAEGSRFRFSTPPDFDIVETVVRAASDLKNEINGSADAILIFSCAGRLSALGPMAQEENEGLHKVWSAPMAGFYTYGEFGKAPNGKHEFHSTTCSWVAMREKS